LFQNKIKEVLVLMHSSRLILIDFSLNDSYGIIIDKINCSFYILKIRNGQVNVNQYKNLRLCDKILDDILFVAGNLVLGIGGGHHQCPVPACQQDSDTSVSGCTANLVVSSSSR
jgi:hypothetical protein